MKKAWLGLATLALGLSLAAAAPSKDRLDSIQAQLAALEKELKEGGGQSEQRPAQEEEESLGRQPRMPVIDFKKRMPVIDFRKRFEENPGEWAPLKRAAWQPLKRAWQPLKRSGNAAEPRIQVALADEEGLAEALLHTVEEHIRSDLETAEAYGLKADQILAHLRAKAQQSPKEKP